MSRMWRWLRRNARQDARPDPDAARDELLSAFLDADLTTDEARALTIQLEADTELRDALAGMRDVKAALGTLRETRAPRAFTLAAPPAAAPSRGLGRLELGVRFGALAAAVAFVLVLAGDLGTGSSSSQDVPTAASSAELAAAGASLEGREQYAQEPEAPVAGASGEAASDGGAGAADSGPATDADGTPTTMLAPLVSATPGGAAGSAPAAPPAPSATTAQRLSEPGADQPADDGTSNGAPSEVTPAPPEARVAVAPASSPVVDPDAPVADSASSADRVAGAGSSGAADFGPPEPTTPPQVAAPEVGTGLRVSVEQRTGIDGLRFTEVALAVLVVLLAATAGWLWYARRRPGAGA